jgi:hypothetical protein
VLAWIENVERGNRLNLKSARKAAFVAGVNLSELHQTNTIFGRVDELRIRLLARGAMLAMEHHKPHGFVIAVVNHPFEFGGRHAHDMRPEVHREASDRKKEKHRD